MLELFSGDTFRALKSNDRVCNDTVTERNASSTNICISGSIPSLHTQHVSSFLSSLGKLSFYQHLGLLVVEISTKNRGE